MNYSSEKMEIYATGNRNKTLAFIPLHVTRYGESHEHVRHARATVRWRIPFFTGIVQQESFSMETQRQTNFWKLTDQ